jgi:Tol biopolymer transport system component
MMIYRWEVLSGKITPITRPPGVGNYSLSPDGKWIYLMQDNHGNDIGHFIRLPIEGGDPEDLTPELSPFISYEIQVSGSGNSVGFTISDQEGFHTWIIGFQTNGQLGELRRVYETKAMTGPPVLSYNGEIAFLGMNYSTHGVNFRLAVLDSKTNEMIGELLDGPGVNHIGYGGMIPSPLPGDCRVLVSTDRSGLPRPLIWNPCSGQRIDLDYPDIPGELAGVDCSPDGRYILVRGRWRARSSLYIYDIEAQKLQQIPPTGGTLTNLQFGPDNQILALWQDAFHPDQVIVLEKRDGSIKTLLAAGGELQGRA